MTTAAATSTIETTYRSRTPASADAGRRAEVVMPAGDTRASGFHLPYPLTVVRGEGARVWDLDGHEYWDLLGNYSSLVHGHAYPPIVEAAERALRGGTAWPARNPAQIELAEVLVERVDSIEQVRFCNSGSEAAMLALAVARLHTGRPKVLMARFGYHGSHEAFEFASHDGHPLPGVEHTVLADYGDAASFEARLAEQGYEIAAVFLEPVLGSGGVVAPPADFLPRVATAARAAGALVVLDEVITFRLAPGGAQALAGVRPDLTMLGKVIGGGFPVGALGGSAAVMEILDPRAGRLVHSGTFNGNPVTAAAGVVSVRHLTPERIGDLDRLAARLQAGLEAAAAGAGVVASVRRVGSLLNLYLSSPPPPANRLRGDLASIAEFHLAALNHGLFFAPRGMMALSTVMTDEVVDDVVERAAAAFADVAAAR